MNLSFLPIAASGVAPASLVWFDREEAFLILMVAVVLSALAILGASAFAGGGTPKVVWMRRQSRPLNKKVWARG
jgi:hypothetical protein